MHIPFDSPFFVRLYLVQKNSRAMIDGNRLPSPFDLVSDALLVAVPGTTVHHVRGWAALDEQFDRKQHSITEVQWVGDERAILGRTIAVCAMPSGDSHSPYVIYGPFDDGDSAEAWMASHFPTTASSGCILYPIQNCFALCLHTWRVELNAVLNSRLAESALRFGDAKQRLMRPNAGEQQGRRSRAEPSFTAVAGHPSPNGLGRGDAELCRLLDMIDPVNRAAAREIVANLLREHTPDA